MLHGEILLLIILAAFITLITGQNSNVTDDNSTSVNEIENGINQIQEEKGDPPFWVNVMNMIVGPKSICNDNEECFQVRGQFAHLRTVPETPDAVDAFFYLHPPSRIGIKNKRSKGEYLGTKLKNSSPEFLANAGFDPLSPIKIIMHGYGDHSAGPTISRLRKALLKKQNTNVVSVDWENGARGPNYFLAVTNGEQVAKQVSLLVRSMIALGANPRNVHIIGFSLGAQVAGFTGAMLKKKNITIGRITGLDPASFTFENAALEADKRLDISDADFVDVIHTDGSLIWTDGFGLLRPVGHVDYFPNGGRDQPGCNDTILDALLMQIRQDKNTGHCSHTRSVDLFIESLDESNCKFVGFPCPGMRSYSRNFLHGNCFSCDGKSCGIMGGSNVKGGGRGSLYLATRNTKPYCGQQLRVTVNVNSETRLSQGSIIVQLNHASSNTSFVLNSPGFFAEMLGIISGGHQELSTIAAAMPGSVDSGRTPVIKALLSFRPALALFSADHVVVDSVTVTSQEGHSWYFCSPNTTLSNRKTPLTIQLKRTPC